MRTPNITYKVDHQHTHRTQQGTVQGRKQLGEQKEGKSFQEALNASNLPKTPGDNNHIR